MVHFTLLLNKVRSFSVKEMFFVSVLFQKSIRLDSGAPLLLKSISYHLNRLKKLFAGAQEPFKWWRTLRGTFSWNLKKYLGRASLKSCFWIFQKQVHRFYEALYILFLSFFIDNMFSSNGLQLFFKIFVLKNFAIFTTKHLCWSVFLMK